MGNICSLQSAQIMKSTIAALEARLQKALSLAFELQFSSGSLLLPASNPKFGDYQSNVAMALSKHLGKPPRAIAEALIQHLDVDDMCEPPQIAGPGFINLTLKTAYLEEQLQQMQLGDRLGIETTQTPQTVIVDFSSPNTAKEMHVGHLRSTIIGDCLARLLEFQGHNVLRLNHVGDWGTQFGMLITHLRTAYPEALTTANALALGDLTTFYKEAKQRFDEDPEFQAASRAAVVQLQSGDADSLKAWKLLCEQSRLAFEEIYQMLGVQLVERGESFYNPFLPDVVEDLAKVGLLVEDQGAKCVFLEGFTNKDGDPLPLIVQKSDGGYNYATTDLAALRYRIQHDKAERIIYVTDAGQANHFAQVWQVARRAGWVPETVELVHVPFGFVQGEDGKKFKTRSGETVRLKDLLDEAIARTQADLEQRLAAEDRQESKEFIQQVARVIGIGAVKYADLSQNRTSNYIFSYDRMLALQGNTAPYLLYAYVRIRGIGRKGQLAVEALTEVKETEAKEIRLQTESEITLAKHLLQLDEVIDAVSQDLMPNRLCQYLFELSQKFNQFYDRCPVLQAEEPLRTSRLGLCDLTARTLKLGLSLLGIMVVERM